MALNVALPLTGYGDLMEFGLLSPISPINTNTIDCREIYKKLISPQGSESSGVSSLDSEEIKKLNSPTKSTSPPTEIESPSIDDQKNEGDDVGAATDENADVDVEKPPTPIADQQQAIKIEIVQDIPQPQPQRPMQIKYLQRNILDLGANLRDKSLFDLRYTVLPEKNNLKIFFANRSQYHRLGANGNVQEYTLVKCNCCDFKYPINGYLTPNNNTNNFNMSTAINNNVVGNISNAKNMINNNAAAANVNNNNNNNNMFQPQMQSSFANNYQNSKSSGYYYNNNNNNNNVNSNNNNNNGYNMPTNAKMLMNQQFNKNMAPTYGLYKQF